MTTTTTEREAIRLLCFRATNALTAYDLRQSKRKGYNPNALAAYCGILNRASEKATLAEVRQALLDGFLPGSDPRRLMEKLMKGATL
jgi:hypothetical protein